MMEPHISVIQNVPGSRFMQLVEESTSPWRKLGQQVHFFFIFKRTTPDSPTMEHWTHQLLKHTTSSSPTCQWKNIKLVNGTTLILPTFQWNNANLANQPLSILSFFLQTKRSCWTCFFPDSRQCCTMGKTPSCLLLILALDKKVCFQYCTHTAPRVFQRKENHTKKKLQ